MNAHESSLLIQYVASSYFDEGKREQSEKELALRSSYAGRGRRKKGTIKRGARGGVVESNIERDL